MKLARWKNNPWHILAQLQEDIDEFFHPLFTRFPRLSGEVTFARVDISEDKDNIYVEADLPGLEQKDIRVTIKEDSLYISGKKEQSKEEKNKNYYRLERSSRNFYRELVLPQRVDSSKVKATYKNGALKLILPKKEEAKQKEINVDIE